VKQRPVCRSCLSLVCDVEAHLWTMTPEGSACCVCGVVGPTDLDPVLADAPLAEKAHRILADKLAAERWAAR
jgi:hypothetical protein